MSQKYKSALPSAVQVKNLRKSVDIEEKLDVLSLFEKGDRIVDICHNVRLAHSGVHTICDNADRFKKVLSVQTTLNANNLKQGMFVCASRLPLSYWNEPCEQI
jgi:hypothetical protein